MATKIYTPDVAGGGGTGPAGPAGDSAYQVAVTAGFVGDVNAWLASLVGADGAQGPAGTPGADGADYPAAVQAVTYNPSGTTTVTLDGTKALYTATAVTGPTTWAFSGAVTPATKEGFDLELTNGGSQTQTWPASVDWDGGVAPTLTAAGVDILTFYTPDGSTNWRGFLAAKDVK